MKNLIKDIDRQPAHLHTLISSLMMARMKGQQIANIPVDSMSLLKQDWLQQEGFEVRFNKQIMEYEIGLS